MGRTTARAGTGGVARRPALRRLIDQGGASATIPTARPLLRPAARSAMAFPLVVLVAVLPGLYALRWWDLNPPGPWWGLRGLLALEGHWLDQATAAPWVGSPAEAEAFRTVALQPPLYAWLEAICLALSPTRAPLATILPGYAAGAVLVLLVYQLGRAWRGPGTGLIAALLFGFSRDLLQPMQAAGPATLGLAGAVGAILAYGRHLGCTTPIGRAGWTVAGGLALGASLLAERGIGLIVVPVILLHQVDLANDCSSMLRPARWWRALRANASLGSGAAALGLGLAIAAPWYIYMANRHGAPFLVALLDPWGREGAGARPSLLRTLVDLAPATLPLAALAAARVLRLAIVCEADDRETVGGSLAVIWAGAAAILPAVWPGGPRASLNLLLLVPLAVLAATAIADLAARRASARALAWLAPATALTAAWWTSSALRDGLGQLADGRRLDPATALGLHLALDLLVVAFLMARLLGRWSRHRDDRRRLVLGGFLGAVLVATVAVGMREVRFRHRETTDLLMVRSLILGRQQARPFDLVAIVGPPIDSATAGPARPAGRLPFLLHAALPGLRPIYLDRPEDLHDLPDVNRLVLVVGRKSRLSYAFQSQLGLETIHPGRSGLLDAFATTPERPDAQAAR